MVPKWLKSKLGNHMRTPVELKDALDKQEREADEANIKGEQSLEEIRVIRVQSEEIHKEVKKALRENHFAEMVLRVLEPR